MLKPGTTIAETRPTNTRHSVTPRHRTMPCPQRRRKSRIVRRPSQRHRQCICPTLVLAPNPTQGPKSGRHLRDHRLRGRYPSLHSHHLQYTTDPAHRHHPPLVSRRTTHLPTYRLSPHPRRHLPTPQHPGALRPHPPHSTTRPSGPPATMHSSVPKPKLCQPAGQHRQHLVRRNQTPLLQRHRWSCPSTPRHRHNTPCPPPATHSRQHLLQSCRHRPQAPRPHSARQRKALSSAQTTAQWDQSTAPWRLASARLATGSCTNDGQAQHNQHSRRPHPPTLPQRRTRQPACSRHRQPWPNPNTPKLHGCTR